MASFKTFFNIVVSVTLYFFVLYSSNKLLFTTFTVVTMAKATKRKTVDNASDEIISRIYFVRDQKVMLDYDLAVLYEVETKALNQAVKRNIERFLLDFKE